VVRSLQTVALHKTRQTIELNVLLIAGIVHKCDAKHQQKDVQTFGLYVVGLVSYDQWFFCSAGGGGSVFDPLPSSPFPSLPPLPSLSPSSSLPLFLPPLLSPSFPLPCREAAPSNQLGGLGERCELPQRSGRSPAAKRFWCLLWAENWFMLVLNIHFFMTSHSTLRM
jgi:hypothetical protein